MKNSAVFLFIISCFHTFGGENRIIMMRKALLIVALMLFPLGVCIPLHSATSSDVTGIPLTGGTGEGGGGDGGGEDPQSVSLVPITCSLSDSGTSLQFGFLDDLGFVTVTLMNLSTGEIESGVLDSQLGIVDFPFSGGAGFYRIIITTSSGGYYHGSFSI